MSGASPAKFLFDRRLDDRNTRSVSFAVAEERRKAEAALERARQEAYAKGFAEGEQTALATAATQTAQALEAIAVATRALLDQTAHMAASLRHDCTALAIAAARCLAEELVRREPLAELETLFLSCLGELRDELQLVITVRESLRDDAALKLGQLAEERGFTGALVVNGSAELAAGDCRIEWLQGGLERNKEAILAAIVERVRRHLDHNETGMPTGFSPSRTTS